MMLLRPAAFATAISVALLPVIGNAQSMTSPMLVQTTPHYTVTLTIGPAEEMISPADAMSGGTGEVMVNGGSMSSMPSHSMSGGDAMSMGNTMMDQGMAVNHHLEVHVEQGNAVVDSVTPVIRVTDKSTGQFRDLPQVMAMYDTHMGMSDFHYGQNVWLPDGTYTINVMLGTDSAVFRDVVVAGGSPMMGMGGSTSMTDHPMTGSPATPNPTVATDGATLAGQPADVQALFNAVWGARAAAEWATEHNMLMGMH